MGLDLGQKPAEGAAAAVSYQRQAATPLSQLVSQRIGRKHVPAGATGGEDDQSTLSGSHDRPPLGAGASRVSASIMPMLNARAMVDEPP